MKVFPGNVGNELAVSCANLLQEAKDRGDSEAAERLASALFVWESVRMRSDPSAKHADCARRRMVMMLAWLVEHVAERQP